MNIVLFNVELDKNVRFPQMRTIKSPYGILFNIHVMYSQSFFRSILAFDFYFLLVFLPVCSSYPLISGFSPSNQ